MAGEGRREKGRGEEVRKEGKGRGWERSPTFLQVNHWMGPEPANVGCGPNLSTGHD